MSKPRMFTRQAFSVIITADQEFEEVLAVEVAVCIEASCLAPEHASIEVRSLQEEPGTRYDSDSGISF